MKKLLASLVCACVGAVSVFADAVTIPTTGVDVGAYATTAITSLGSVVGICVGGMFAFILVRWGIRWAKGIGRQ